MIRIVTDTSCDLPTPLLDEHRVVAVPLTIRFGDDEFVDRENLEPEDFWQRLTTTVDLPQTAAPSAGRFESTYRRLVSEGATGIVAVTLSSQLSATMQAAQVAADAVAADVPVHVVDSGLTSIALGLVVLEAARTAAGGASLDDVVAATHAAMTATNVFAALDTLEFLKRGGRIGPAQAFFGGLLNVKPLITLADGVVAPAGRVRTRRKALAALLERAAELEGRIAELAILHADAPDVETFREAVATHHPTAPTVVTLLGPVVGTHTGPGLIGLCYRLG